MRFSNLTLLGLFVPFAHAQEDPRYSHHCNNVSLINMDDRFGLRAYCPTSPGKDRQCSILDLDQCYGEVGDLIKPQDMGHLSQRCFFCQIMETTLECRCGNKIRKQVNLDDLIVVDHSSLKCFNNRATTPPDCEQIALASKDNRDPVVQYVSIILSWVIILWL
ncbi:hypothetical protein F4804DRAFT_339203 [Jackrogersella minutella]|nr:hypothetical protein F4804DRAFT_339203 [Jackrogersella minutella]